MSICGRSCTARVPFVGNKSGELTFRAGEVLTEVVENDTGWWEGVLKKQRGLFPSNYVSRNYRLQLVCKALCNWTGFTDGPMVVDNELRLDADELLMVDDKDAGGKFWHGVTHDGRTGWFPRSLVKVLSEKPHLPTSATTALTTSMTPSPTSKIMEEPDMYIKSEGHLFVRMLGLKELSVIEGAVAVRIGLWDKGKRPKPIFVTTPQVLSPDIVRWCRGAGELFRLNVKTAPFNTCLIVEVETKKGEIGGLLVRLTGPEFDVMCETPIDARHVKWRKFNGRGTKRISGLVKLELYYHPLKATVSQRTSHIYCKENIRTEDGLRRAILEDAGVDPSAAEDPVIRAIVDDAVAAALPKPSYSIRPSSITSVREDSEDSESSDSSEDCSSAFTATVKTSFIETVKTAYAPSMANKAPPNRPASRAPSSETLACVMLGGSTFTPDQVQCVGARESSTLPPSAVSLSPIRELGSPKKKPVSSGVPLFLGSSPGAIPKKKQSSPLGKFGDWKSPQKSSINVSGFKSPPVPERADASPVERPPYALFDVVGPPPTLPKRASTTTVPTPSEIDAASWSIGRTSPTNTPLAAMVATLQDIGCPASPRAEESAEESTALQAVGVDDEQDDTRKAAKEAAANKTAAKEAAATKSAASKPSTENGGRLHPTLLFPVKPTLTDRPSRWGVVAYSWKGNASNEIAFADAGTTVLLLELPREEWVLVRCYPSREEGFMPVAYISSKALAFAPALTKSTQDAKKMVKELQMQQHEFSALLQDMDAEKARVEEEVDRHKDKFDELQALADQLIGAEEEANKDLRREINELTRQFEEQKQARIELETLLKLSPSQVISWGGDATTDVACEETDRRTDVAEVPTMFEGRMSEFVLGFKSEAAAAKTDAKALVSGLESLGPRDGADECRAQLRELLTLDETVGEKRSFVESLRILVADLEGEIGEVEGVVKVLEAGVESKRASIAGKLKELRFEARMKQAQEQTKQKTETEGATAKPVGGAGEAAASARSKSGRCAKTEEKAVSTGQEEASRATQLVKDCVGEKAEEASAHQSFVHFTISGRRNAYEMSMDWEDSEQPFNELDVDIPVHIKKESKKRKDRRTDAVPPEPSKRPVPRDVIDVVRQKIIGCEDVYRRSGMWTNTAPDLSSSVDGWNE